MGISIPPVFTVNLIIILGNYWNCSETFSFDKCHINHKEETTQQDQTLIPTTKSNQKNHEMIISKSIQSYKIKRLIKEGIRVGKKEKQNQKSQPYQPNNVSMKMKKQHGEMSSPLTKTGWRLTLMRNCKYFI